MKRPVSESLLDKVAVLQIYEKEAPTLVFCSEFCKILNNICFKEHLRTIASGNISHWAFFIFTISSKAFTEYFSSNTVYHYLVQTYQCLDLQSFTKTFLFHKWN